MSIWSRFTTCMYIRINWIKRENVECFEGWFCGLCIQHAIFTSDLLIFLMIYLNIYVSYSICWSPGNRFSSILSVDLLFLNILSAGHLLYIYILYMMSIYIYTIYHVYIIHIMYSIHIYIYPKKHVIDRQCSFPHPTWRIAINNVSLPWLHNAGAIYGS